MLNWITQFFAFFVPTWLDGVALVTNVGSVGALALNRKWLGWILGIIGSAALLIIFLRTGLVFDSTLMVYYLITGGLGTLWWAIVPRRKQKKDLAITDMPTRYWYWIVPLVVVLTVASGYILRQVWPDNPLGLFVYVDAFTTALSIVAQWMLARKWMQNWHVWILADVVDIWLYGTKGLPMVAVLTVIYLAQCVFAEWKWGKIRAEQEGDENVLDNSVAVAPAL